MPLDVEIVVVDDGSTDSTHKSIARINHPNLRYIRQSNQGPASARNTGVNAATGEYIAFTDDDCIPVSSWPWPLVNRLEKEAPHVSGVGGKVLSLNRGVLSRYYIYHRILEPPESCSYLVTANCAYRAEHIRLAGGFNTQIKQPGGEDPGLSFAIRAKGYRLVYDSNAVVVHDFRQSIIDFTRTFYRYGKGCSYSSVSEDAQLLGHNELVPTPISSASLKNELERAWKMYATDNLTTSERLKFLSLVVLQKFAYNAGWNKGVKLQQSVSPDA